MSKQQMLFHMLILSLIFSIGRTEMTAPNCSCGVLSTYYINHRFGCECFREQPMTNQSVFPVSSLPVNLTILYLGVREEEWESFRYPYCQADISSYSYLSADTMRPWEGTRLQFISFTNFDFTKGRAKQISPWLENVKSTLAELEIVCGRLLTLTTGVFVGFSNLTKLTITSTSLQNIEPGAFSEMSAGGLSVLTTLDLSFSSLWHFDWAVLQPAAASLESFVLSRSGLKYMRGSLEPFPKLRRLELDHNLLYFIPETVVKTWPKSNDLAVSLNSNPLCSWDSLCRCCSLLPLFHFANETSAWIFLECGNLESVEKLDKTSFSGVRPETVCTDKYATRMTAEEFMEVGNMSQFDRCIEEDEPADFQEVLLCNLPVSSGLSVIPFGENHQFANFALTLILIQILRV